MARPPPWGWLLGGIALGGRGKFRGGLPAAGPDHIYIFFAGAHSCVHAAACLMHSGHRVIA